MSSLYINDFPGYRVILWSYDWYLNRVFIIVSSSKRCDHGQYSRKIAERTFSLFLLFFWLGWTFPVSDGTDRTESFNEVDTIFFLLINYNTRCVGPDMLI